MAPRRSETGVHTWVFVLGALYALERNPATAPIGTAVLRETLRLSGMRGTVRLELVKQALDNLADDGLCECERIGESVHWRLTTAGRAHFRTVVERMAILADELDDRDDAYAG